MWDADGTRLAAKIVNIAYPIVVMLFIIFAYIVQYAACFRRDRVSKLIR